MTTLDDAAERTIEEIANGLSIHSFADAARQAWIEATEAAAKKCDDLADGNASSMAYVCAAAIRGGKL